MEKEIFLIADRIRSLYNVGSLFRTADAFRVSKLYLCGYTGAPPRREIAKVALGAEQAVPWEKRVQTWKAVEDLRARGVYVAVLEIGDGGRRMLQHAHRDVTRRLKPAATISISINKFHPHFPLALIVGNEVNGVSPSVLRRADAIVHIPMLGKKESLNVAVAAGVALYAIRYPNF